MSTLLQSPVGWWDLLRLAATNRILFVAFAFAAAVACAAPARAQQPAVQREPLFPSGDVYPIYIADTHRPTNMLAETFIVGGSIPSTRSPLTRLAAGGRFGLLRFESASPEGRAWQFSLEAGFDALFDSRNRLDAVGWDGNYGWTLTTAASGPLALKIAMLHVSAHLGDEYQDRTGRDRFNYTREEVAVGAAWRWSPRTRAYGEVGWAYHEGNPLLEPWRAQGGIEFETQPGRCGWRFGCYAAADFGTMEERNWKLDVTISFGIVTKGVGRTSRLFFEWHDGRPTLNEFFRESVSTLTLGLKIDL